MALSARHHASEEPASRGGDAAPDLDRVDEQLLAELEHDVRFASGLAGSQQAGELEFIQMTGITRTRFAPIPEAMAAEEPVNFYEEGVADVDERMAPGGFPEPEDAPGDFVRPEAPMRSKSAEALRALVAELKPGDHTVSPGTAAAEETEGGAPVSGPEWVAGDADDAVLPDSRERSTEDFPEARVLDALVDLLGGDAKEREATADTLEMPGVEDALDAAGPVSPESSGPRQQLEFPEEESDGQFTPEARLAEAEDLLRALESQPRDEAPDVPEDSFPWQAGDFEAERGSNPHTGAPRRRVPGPAGWTLLLLCLAALAVGGYFGFAVYLAPLAPSRAPAAADAETLFQAAVAMQLEPAPDEQAAHDRDRRALAQFELFVREHPGHAKTPRARVLMGILEYRLGDHAQAVQTLSPFLESGHAGLDPEARTPALRTLARSHARLGHFSDAAEAYRAAVASPLNTTPETDYEELGGLMLEWASTADPGADKELLQQAAADYWSLAIAVPGIDPLERARIRQQRDALLEELRAAGDEAAPESGAQPPETHGN